MRERRIAVFAVSNSQISDVLVPALLDWVRQRRGLNVVAGIDTTRRHAAHAVVRERVIRLMRRTPARESADAAFPRVFRRAGIPIIDARGGRGVNEPEIVKRIADLQLDCILSLGCGQILKPGILETATMGIVNYHYSPLPRLGGVHAAFWALLYGDRETANTFHIITPGIDEGPIVIQEPVEIRPADTVASLQNRLVKSATPLLGGVLAQIASGQLTQRAQDQSRRLYRSEKDFQVMQRVCWELPARVIERIAKLNLELRAERASGEVVVMQGFRAVTAPADRRGRQTGEVLSVGAEKTMVACADGAVSIEGIRRNRTLLDKLMNLDRTPNLAVGERLFGRERFHELDDPVIALVQAQAA